LGLLQPATCGSEVTKQLEVGCHASSSGDVSMQVADASLVARNRSELWRKASLNGHPFDSQNRRTSTEGRQFQHAHREFSGEFPLAQAFPHSGLWKGCGRSVQRRGTAFGSLQMRLMYHKFHTG